MSMGCDIKRKTGFLLVNQYGLLPSVKKNLLTQSHFGHLGHCVDGLDAIPPIMVQIDETEDEIDGWPKVTENQTNLLSQQGSTVKSWSQYDLLHNNSC